MEFLKYPIVDVSHLDSFFLDENGRIKAVDAYELHQINEFERNAWAWKNSIYQFVTQEMVQSLKERIAGRPAIEICSGVGGLGHLLGIAMTDSYVHTEKVGMEYCIHKNERPIYPDPEHVIRMEANVAIDYDKPKVVIGAFVPPKYKHEHGHNFSGGQIWGVDEELLLRKVETYILFDHLGHTPRRRILEMKIPVSENSPLWQVTRYKDQSLNRMWIFDKRMIHKSH